MRQAGELGSQPPDRPLNQGQIETLVKNTVSSPKALAQLLQLHNWPFPGEFVVGFQSLSAAGKTM